MWVPELEGESGKKYIRFEVLGDSNVAVPTHLYKVNHNFSIFIFQKLTLLLDHSGGRSFSSKTYVGSFDGAKQTHSGNHPISGVEAKLLIIRYMLTEKYGKMILNFQNV